MRLCKPFKISGTQGQGFGLEASYVPVQYPEQTVFKSEDVDKIRAKAAEQEKLSIVELERIRLEQLERIRVEQLENVRKQKEEQDLVRFQQKQKRIRAHAEELKKLRQKEDDRLRQEEETARQWQLETERLREEKRWREQEEERKLFVRHSEADEREVGYSGYSLSAFPSELGVSKSSITGSVQRDPTGYEAGYAATNYDGQTNYGPSVYDDSYSYRTTSYEDRASYGTAGTGDGSATYNDRNNYGSAMYETRSGPGWSDPNLDPEKSSNYGLTLPNPANSTYRRHFDKPY